MRCPSAAVSCTLASISVVSILHAADHSGQRGLFDQAGRVRAPSGIHGKKLLGKIQKMIEENKLEQTGMVPYLV